MAPIKDLGKYSTNEIKVGTWIDGKPLYRKVIKGTSWSSFNHNIANVDNIFIDASASYLYWDEWRAPFPVFSSGTSNYCIAAINKTTVKFDRGGSVGGNGFVLTLMYTKTTDMSLA